MNGDPTNTHEVCEHVLDIIEEVTKSHSTSRTLHKQCRRDFRQGDLDLGDPNRKPGNLIGFDRIFSSGGSWDGVKVPVERAANLHGTLCNIAADFRDQADGTKSTEIDPLLFRWAGQLVRKLCPPSIGGSLEKAAAAAGASCTWP